MSLFRPLDECFSVAKNMCLVGSTLLLIENCIGRSVTLVGFLLAHRSLLTAHFEAAVAAGSMAVWQDPPLKVY